jgi:ferrochelatase
MKFYATQFKHDQAEKIGVLLINLGSPDAPDSRSIRRFLRQFLSDSRVIEMPQFFWKLILYGFILPFRPKKLVPLYQSIWTDTGSPLVSIATEQKNKLVELFTHHKDNHNIIFSLAMCYGKPDIASSLRYLAQNNARKIIIFPTYAQYSGSTTGAIFDAVTTELQSWRWIPELRFINNYHDQPAHIQALADSLRYFWQSHKPSQKLLLSFHGLPESYHLQGDPYFCQCHKTARLIAENLGLNETQWLISFQSRFGRAEWLKPYTSETLKQLAIQGIQSVDVICPGFAMDCLETLEEIAVENRDIFLQAGGQRYQYIPALNDSENNIHAMAELIEQQLQGWQVTSASQDLIQRQRRKSVKSA